MLQSVEDLEESKVLLVGVDRCADGQLSLGGQELERLRPCWRRFRQDGGQWVPRVTREGVLDALA